MQGDAAGWPNEVYCELYHELNGPGANAKSGSKLLTLGQKKGLPTPQHHTMGR